MKNVLDDTVVLSPDEAAMMLIAGCFTHGNMGSGENSDTHKMEDLILESTELFVLQAHFSMACDKVNYSTDERVLCLARAGAKLTKVFKFVKGFYCAREFQVEEMLKLLMQPKKES